MPAFKCFYPSGCVKFTRALLLFAGIASQATYAGARTIYPQNIPGIPECESYSMKIAGV